MAGQSPASLSCTSLAELRDALMRCFLLGPTCLCDINHHTPESKQQMAECDAVRQAKMRCSKAQVIPATQGKMFECTFYLPLNPHVGCRGSPDGAHTGLVLWGQVLERAQQVQGVCGSICADSSWHLNGAPVCMQSCQLQVLLMSRPLR